MRLHLRKINSCMYRIFLFFFSLIILGATPFGVYAQCPDSLLHFRIEIDPDEYFEEVSWKITGLSGPIVYGDDVPVNDGPQTFNYCVAPGCIAFQLFDIYGDGMFPDGTLKLYINDSLVFETIGENYGHDISFTLGCGKGDFCNDPFVIDTGAYTTVDDQDTWFLFTPADTGIYHITACDSQFVCQPKIWVYSTCNPTTVFENNLGALFYADSGCSDSLPGSHAEVYLGANRPYFVRIGFENGACNGAVIPFEIAYGGPVKGCTDPLACNYQPLATISDTCIYPGDPACGDLPDLVVRQDLLRNSLQYELYENDDACAVEEGCIRGFGFRHLLRFSTWIQNIGVADYFIGETPETSETPSDQFIWDPCHLHWHYRGYAEYLLFDDQGIGLPVGSKNGFCVLDLECPDSLSKYSCENMGITAGCGDIYDYELPCQWIDITDVPTGTYTMVVRVNWDKSPDKTGRPEKNYDNNWAQACFTLEYDANGNPIFKSLDEDCPIYTDCSGEPYGNAQPDCNGVCNGPALRGDIDQDTLRTQADLSMYLTTALDTSALAVSCNDLDENGTIDLYDAALFQECHLYGDSIAYWGTRFACRFPSGIENPADLVLLSAGMLDTINKTFDVQVVNPYNDMIGFEFSIAGLEIDSIKNQAPGFSPVWQVNHQTGELLALGAETNRLHKNNTPENLIRIHYSAITMPEVCLTGITTVVNRQYQRANASLGDPACVNTVISSTYQPKSPLSAIVIPNPAKESVSIFFDNIASEPLTVTFLNTSGKVIKRLEGLRTNSVTLERQNLPAGIYFYRLESRSGTFTGKISFK